MKAGLAILEGLLARMAGREERLAHASVLEARWRELGDRTGDEALDLMARWTAAQVDAIGARGCVLGASGGVDSSLVAVVLARGLPGRCSALLMPCRSSREDEQDARRLLDLLGIPHRTVPMEPAVERLLADLGATPEQASPMTVGNLASRLRSAALYFEANATGSLVVGTGDLDETYIGYTSKGTTADLFPITGLHKDEVRALLRRGLEPLDPELAVRLSERPASPGYWPGQKAEDEIGMSYTRLGNCLDLVTAHCEIRPTGVFPRDPEAFLADVQARGVGVEEFLAVADRVAANYHKSFGSPALWRG